MGCDIHGYLEYAYHNIPDVWVSYEDPKPDYKGELDLDRNYFMFSLLANVRCNRSDKPAPYPPRGYPKDMSIAAMSGHSYDVFEEGDPRLGNNGWYNNEETGESGCSRKDADKWHYVDSNKTKVWDPDRHTPSWLTYKEYCVVFDKFKSEILKDGHEWHPNCCWEKLVDTMKSLVDEGYFVRFVFSFDN
jgi:hypothetical protein